MVSIITITYNRAILLKKTIESVLKQSYHNWEYIIIDDGSDDNTQEMIHSFQSSKILYKKLNHSGKLGYLRNYGIEMAKGEFIAFLDSDDIWDEKKLELQVRLMLGNPKLDYSICNFYHFNELGTDKKTGYISNNNIEANNLFKEYFNDNLPIYPSTLLIKKSCFYEYAPFDESLPVGDVNFLYKLTKYYLGSVLFDRLVKIRKHSTNLSLILGMNIPEEIIYTLDIFYANGMITKNQYRDKTMRYHYMGGLYLLKNGKIKEARQQFKRAFSTKFHLKSILRYILTFRYYTNKGKETDYS